MADRSMLARATDGTDAPTPGYLYVDIAKNASSSPTATQEIAQYLTRRMSGRTNPNIKYKCLKVIAKTASTQKLFQRTIVQDSTAVSTIKECLQFRGPPDPARGDEPSEKVRTAAKEALDAIYSDAPQQQASGGSMQGIGSGGYGSGAPPSSSYGASGAPPPPGPRRMEGIGNPMFQDPRQEPQRSGPPATMDVIREVGRTVKNMIEDPLATRATQHQQPQSSMPGYGGGGYSNPPGRSQLQNNTGGQWNMASNRGPNAVTGSDSYYKQNQPYDWASKNSSNGAATGGVGGSWGAGGVSSAARQPPAPVTSSASYQPSTTGFGGGGTASSDGQYEKNLVMELCPPGGLKAEPPPEKLLQFQQAIPSLNPDLICPVLLDCLEDGQPWIMRGKALRVMKVSIEVGVGEDGVNKYADFFHECRAEIEPLVNHNRPAISEPAKQILQLLGLDGAGGAETPASAAPAPSPAADLLDFGDPQPAPSANAVPASAPSSGGGGSLFGGLQVQGASSSQTPAVLAPAAAATDTTVAPSSSSGSLFGGLQVQGAPSAEPTPAPVPKAEKSFLDATPPELGGSAFGFMQETPAPAAPSAPLPAASSGFSFMQETASTAPAPLPAESGSGFDFMQQAESMQVPTPPPITPHTPSRSQPATFDPLAQGYQPSPNSANKQAAAAMQQQQQQMAAMFNQQQMLMMQHQMQQMQLAMAMQKGQVSAGKQPMMTPAGAGMNTTSSFSFLDVGAKPPSSESQEKDKKFDFVKDALKNHKKK